MLKLFYFLFFHIVLQVMKAPRRVIKGIIYIEGDVYTKSQVFYFMGQNIRVENNLWLMGGWAMIQREMLRDFAIEMRKDKVGQESKLEIQELLSNY